MKTTNYAASLALDWGDKQHAFALQPREGARETGTINAAAEILHGWLDRLGQRFGGQPVAVVVEAGRDGVVHALFEHAWLTIYPVHSTASAHFREALVPSGAKDDTPDAEVLLTLFEHHRGRLRPLLRDTAETRRLELLVATRRDAVDQRTLFTNQLCSVLKGYFPQALDALPDELYTPLALDFLTRWPTLASTQAARPATLRQFYHRHNSRRTETIEERLAVLVTARPLTTDEAIIEVSSCQVQLLVAVLRTLQRGITELEERIAAAFAAHPEAALYYNLPGAGPRSPHACWSRLAPTARALRTQRACKNTPASHLCARKAAGRAGRTGAGIAPSSCGKVLSSGRDRRCQSAAGRKPFTARRNKPA